MNKKNSNNQEDKLIRQFITKQSHHPGENRWFTRRVVNRLPQSQTQSMPACIIMTTVTIIAVIMCCAFLHYTSHNFLSLRENNLTGELLCMYIALMSTVLLVVLQVIRLIKTYF